MKIPLPGVMNTVITSKSNVINPTGVSPIRARSFKINSVMQNFSQYVRTVKAYALAGLPLEHIANAGDFLGDPVERKEIDTNLLNNWQTKAGEIAEDENKIMAWQSRGEQISIVNQLGAAQPLEGTEIVPITNNLTTANSNSPQTLNVLEGIAVFNNQPPQLPPNQTNSQLENNPYLRTPANLKNP